MAVGEGWQLLKIRGIPLRIHPTWFVILFVATMAFEQHYRLSLAGQASPGLLWAVALVTAVMLFVSCPLFPYSFEEFMLLLLFTTFGSK